MVITLHIEYQHGVAQSQWGPQLQSILLRQEVVVDRHDGDHGCHGEDQDHGSLQRGQDAVSGGQEADALPTVPLRAV